LASGIRRRVLPRPSGLGKIPYRLCFSKPPVLVSVIKGRPPLPFFLSGFLSFSFHHSSAAFSRRVPVSVVRRSPRMFAHCYPFSGQYRNPPSPPGRGSCCCLTFFRSVDFSRPRVRNPLMSWHAFPLLHPFVSPLSRLMGTTSAPLRRVPFQSSITPVPADVRSVPVREDIFFDDPPFTSLRVSFPPSF